MKNMEFVEFKLPKDFGKILGTEYYISYIITNKNGFKIACQKFEVDYDIVFDFGYAVVDYRISTEGQRFEHHTSGKLNEPWLFTEIKNSEYIKKLNHEFDGVLLTINPNLKHYMVGDIDYSIDIISCDKPEVYKAKKTYQKEPIKL